MRHGVVLSELFRLAILAHALLAPGDDGPHPALLVLGGGVLVGARFLLKLPLSAVMRDRRGPLFFCAWSIAVTPVVGADRGVTAIVGVAILASGDDLAAVLHRADEAVYRAKSSGGDQVNAAEGARAVRS